MAQCKIILLFVSLFLCGRGWCGFIPAGNSVLNRTTVYFEEMFSENAVEYELQIYKDSAGSSMKIPLKKIKSRIPAYWVQDLSWGTSYSWRVLAFDKNRAQSYQSEWHRFSILQITFRSFDEIRMDIKTNKEAQHAGGLICIDYTRSIYNRTGRPVWTLPFIKDIVNEGTQIRDLEVTKDNTVTFLTVQQACEINFDGAVLWKAPFPFVLNADTITYHHDFKKTNRGTYMVLGNKLVNRKIIGSYDEETLKNEPGLVRIKGALYRKTVIGILLEFDRAGKLIWYWDASNYISDADLNFKKAPNGLPNFSTHDNAFGENEAGTKVYISFRDLSRIIKIDKKTKKAELSYGDRYPSGDALYGDELFKNQHDANVTRHNSIYIFNNNGYGGGGISSVMELRDNLGSDKDTVCVWKFDLDFDTLSKGKSMNGGNIIELPNTHLLVCAGALNRIFEVTKTKEIVWDAFLFARGKQDTLWQTMPQYRSNWTSQLNEYHFIPLLTAPLIRSDDRSELNIAIHNTGNVADAYQIEVYSETGTLLGSVKTANVPYNAFHNQIIKLKRSGKPYSVRIASQNAPLLIQVLKN